MPDLPIRRMLMYRHGIGYFERRGTVAGAELHLMFPRDAMDDILKSLIVLDLGEGQVLGIDIETPEDRAKQIERGSIHLSDTRSLLDLLRDLRGRGVRLWIEAERRHEPAAEEVLEAPSSASIWTKRNRSTSRCSRSTWQNSAKYAPYRCGTLRAWQSSTTAPQPM